MWTVLGCMKLYNNNINPKPQAALHFQNIKAKYTLEYCSFGTVSSQLVRDKSKSVRIMEIFIPLKARLDGCKILRFIAQDRFQVHGSWTLGQLDRLRAEGFTTQSCRKQGEDFFGRDLTNICNPRV